jgi:hypothetical protein
MSILNQSPSPAYLALAHLALAHLVALPFQNPFGSVVSENPGHVGRVILAEAQSRPRPQTSAPFEFHNYHRQAAAAKRLRNDRSSVGGAASSSGPFAVETAHVVYRLLLSGKIKKHTMSHTISECLDAKVAGLREFPAGP